MKTFSSLNKEGSIQTAWEIFLRLTVLPIFSEAVMKLLLTFYLFDKY